MGQLVHLLDVTEDAVTCTWQSVRHWLCLMFDLVEKGRITWADSQLIQNYRMRNTVRSHNAGSVQYGQNKTEVQCTNDVPCTDFNSGSCQSGGIAYFLRHS